MRNSYRILVSELILTTFLSTILLPSQILFAEDVAQIPSDTTQTTEASTTGSPDSIVPVGPDSTSTDMTIPAGSTESGPIVPDTAIGGMSTGSTTTIGTIPDMEISVVPIGDVSNESEIDLADPSLKMTPHPIDTNPDTQILVQFKSDIDSYVGQYQVDQVENIHALQTTETLSEQNIAVMEIKPSLVITERVLSSVA